MVEPPIAIVKSWQSAVYIYLWSKLALCWYFRGFICMPLVKLSINRLDIWSEYVSAVLNGGVALHHSCMFAWCNILYIWSHNFLPVCFFFFFSEIRNILISAVSCCKLPKVPVYSAVVAFWVWKYKGTRWKESYLACWIICSIEICRGDKKAQGRPKISSYHLERWNIKLA